MTRRRFKKKVLNILELAGDKSENPLRGAKF